MRGDGVTPELRDRPAPRGRARLGGGRNRLGHCVQLSERGSVAEGESWWSPLEFDPDSCAQRGTDHSASASCRSPWASLRPRSLPHGSPTSRSGSCIASARRRSSRSAGARRTTVRSTQDEIVRGFEVTKGQFLIVEDADLEAIERADDSRSIEITRFVKQDDVDPIFFDRTYFLVPAAAHGAAPTVRAAARGDAADRDGRARPLRARGPREARASSARGTTRSRSRRSSSPRTSTRRPRSRKPSRRRR